MFDYDESKDDVLTVCEGQIKVILTDVYDKGLKDGYRLAQTNAPMGWIPVSERLPEICEKDCHGNITFSKMVLSTQIFGNGFVYVGNDKYTTNNGGAWLSEVPDECCKVIAWMPLPEPWEGSRR